MKRGFTLIELQVTLMLTLVVLSLLYLFTYYFLSNYHQYVETTAFRRDCFTFFRWIDTHMRNASRVQLNKTTVHFHLRDGRTETLSLAEQGPNTSSQPFFRSLVQVQFSLDPQEEGRLLQVSVHGQEERVFRFRYRVFPDYGLAEKRTSGVK